MREFWNSPLFLIYFLDKCVFDPLFNQSKHKISVRNPFVKISQHIQGVPQKSMIGKVFDKSKPIGIISETLSTGNSQSMTNRHWLAIDWIPESKLLRLALQRLSVVNFSENVTLRISDRFSFGQHQNEALSCVSKTYRGWRAIFGLYFLFNGGGVVLGRGPAVHGRKSKITLHAKINKN